MREDFSDRAVQGPLKNREEASMWWAGLAGACARKKLADQKLRDVRIGGHFRAGDVDELLESLRRNFPIDSRRDSQGRVVLSSLARGLLRALRMVGW